MKIALIAAFCVLAAACGIIIPMPATLQMFPVQGPLAAQATPPVVSASVLATVGYSKISMTFPDGETFEGPLSREAPADSARDELAPLWDSIYGSGHYLAHVLGTPLHSWAVLKGSRGTTLTLETILEGESPPEGVARDSNGNTFKVTH